MKRPMVAFLRQPLLAIRSRFTRRARLEAENLILRQHLVVLRRKCPKRVRLWNIDRLLLAWVYRLYPSRQDSIIIVQPETVIRWHRSGFRAYWRWKSRHFGGRPRIDSEASSICQGLGFDYAQVEEVIGVLLTTQCLIKGYAGNEEDGIYTGLRDAKSRVAVTVDFAPLKDGRTELVIQGGLASDGDIEGSAGYTAALAVYQGTVDGAATFIDARDSLVATTPDIKTKTKVIDTAGPIPNDGVAVGKNFPADVTTQVKSALIDYSKTDDGKKVFTTLFSWDGMQEVTATFYDDMKTAAALAGIDVQGLANLTPRPAPTTAAPSKTP